MAILVASIVVYAMLSLVVNLLGTERQETAKTQTQIEMGQAMDYIASEMEQAAYIYEGECLVEGRGVGNGNDPTYCPGLTNVISFPPEVTPVLAFWKLEEVPYVTNPTGSQQLPDRCLDLAQNQQEECYAIKNSRSSYTLVVYGLRTDDTDTWEGPARITRYELRKYNSDNLVALEQTNGYTDPQDPGITFQTWPDACNNTGCNAPPTLPNNYSDDVLIDLVDDDRDANTGGTATICDNYDYGTTTTTTYSLSPPTNTPDGFYACVAEPSGFG